MHAPSESHWSVVKRILRYLKNTIMHGLFISKNSLCDIQAYSDFDWLGCTDDRRSTGGYVIYLSNNLVSWLSRKQWTVSCSSTESEYKALADTTAEITWLQS